MTSQEILQADLLDILFENRNKAYGAYSLRRAYQQQLTKAVIIAIGSGLLLFVAFRPTNAATKAAHDEGRIVVVKQIPPPAEKKIEPSKPAAIKKQAFKQQMLTDQIEFRQNVVTRFPPQDLLQASAISDRTTPGDATGNFQPVGKDDAGKSETQSKTTEAEKPKEAIPDKQPQFPGGMQAWLNFLSRNLQAPEELAGGEKRTVLIRFHVAEDGSIANVQVVQSAGAAFDAEVLRVLKKMPNWSPAMLGGQPVSVSFTQPVTFVGVEE